ncbi:gastrula zinc finger protein XlCGF67.1-like [Pseudorasbora parva]|uniref:gastrula zinc finger protein XlCGF67.1-like n=1 Tax=Pseudorasbora parva TaxID=51549 RepID=UPI00351E8C71
MEVFSVKHEETEEQTDLMQLKEESQEWKEREKKKQHMKDHDYISGESFSCSMTKKIFLIKTETKRDFTCQQCGKSFTNKTILEIHMRVHTGEKQFTCQQCGKSFSQKGNFNVHMKLHTGEKPFTCNLCGKSFLQKENT